jgi:predicted transcriptional regulator
MVEAYDIDRRFYEATKKSRSHSAVTALLHPNFAEMAHELIDCRVRLNFVISRKLYDKLIRDNYSSLAQLLKNGLVQIFVFPGKMDFQYVSYNDHCIMLAPIRNDGSIDNRYLLCSSSDTLQWGREFFEHYVNRSVPLAEI